MKPLCQKKYLLWKRSEVWYLVNLQGIHCQTIPDDDAQEISDFIPECPVLSQKVIEDELSREDVVDKAMSNIVKAQAHQKRNYDKRCNPVGFKVGDEVLLQEVKNKARVGKFDTRYTGPYTIIDEVRKGVYRLERDGKPLKKTINGSRLKQYVRCDDSPEKDCEITGVGSNPSHKPALPKFHPLDGHQLDAICKSRYWLTDIEVNAAQALLHQQFPEVDGFQDTCLSQGNFFQPPRNEFIQIFNVNQSHWIALSTVGCPSGHVNVYDSLYRHLHSDTRSTIASLLQSRDNVLTVVMPEVQKQSNGSDCGVYAIAFSTAILNSIDIKAGQ